MIDFLASIVKLFTDLKDTIAGTSDRIDQIKFDATVFHSYLGYAKYAMGTPLYTLFTSVILIGIGVAMWTWLIKGVNWIRGIM